MGSEAAGNWRPRLAVVSLRTNARLSSFTPFSLVSSFKAKALKQQGKILRSLYTCHFRKNLESVLVYIMLFYSLSFISSFGRLD